jgi:YD repeat-containing protein
MTPRRTGIIRYQGKILLKNGLSLFDSDGRNSSKDEKGYVEKLHVSRRGGRLNLSRRSIANRRSPAEITVRDALNNVSTTVYDTEGNVTKTVDARANVTTMLYDKLTRAYQTINAIGGISTPAQYVAGSEARPAASCIGYASAIRTGRNGPTASTTLPNASPSASRPTAT